ncbi:MAG: hypothetical protein CVU05_02305, partial [Bacteroidetes bacterium HGW-Bacteroidetes-21]
LKKELNDDIQIVSVWPDSLKIEFSKSAVKKIPVNLLLTYTTGSQYISIRPPTSFPDSVTVIGPIHILDTITRLNTESIDLGVINTSSEGMLSMIADKNLRIIPPTVKYQVNLDRYTEKEFNLSPIIINVPDSVRIMFWPEKISVRLSVALSKFNEFDSRDINVFADFKKLGLNNKNLPLEINHLPEGVFNPIIFPSQIECNIQK